MTTAATITTFAATTVVDREVQKDEVIIFPFMAKGHTIPLLHLASALSRRGLRVTVVTTPANAPFIRRYLPSHRHPLVTIHTLPFPLLPPLPPGVESTDHLPSFDLYYPTFLRATALLADPFDSLLRCLVASGAASPPLCLISDFFLSWTLPICRRLRLPRLVFHGTSAFSMALCNSFMLHQPHSGGEAAFHLPGAPPSLFLTQAELPDGVRCLSDPDNPLAPFLLEVCKAAANGWGIVVNSFSEIDRDYVELVESFYPPGARAWLVGPLCLLPADSVPESDPGGCLKWLDDKARDSVVYVSFGTQAHVSDAQLDEVVYGLADSGHEFLLVARSPTWVPPLDPESRGSKVVRGWVPQGEVLRHAAVGGFVSHCGWNSVLESLSAGVPILAWPMMAEQALNARHVADLMGAGLSLGLRCGEIIGREEVAEGVREVMGSGGERGRRARERAAELQRAAAEAVAEGGSSQVELEDLLTKLREVGASGSGGGGGEDEGLLDVGPGCTQVILQNVL